MARSAGPVARSAGPVPELPRWTRTSTRRWRDDRRARPLTLTTKARKEAPSLHVVAPAATSAAATSTLRWLRRGWRFSSALVRRAAINPVRWHPAWLAESLTALREALPRERGEISRRPGAIGAPDT